MELSLVLPCYKESPHLERNIKAVLRVLKQMDVSFEIVLVDDASPDGTADVIRKIVAAHPDGTIRAIFHERNLGRGAAFLSGVPQTTGDIVGFFDIDLEVSAEYLPQFLHKLKVEKADLAVGYRYYAWTFCRVHRMLMSRVYRRLTRMLLGLPDGIDSECGYKFFRRSTLAPLVEKFEHKGWFWDTEVVSRFIWDGLKVISVPVVFVRDPSKMPTVNPLSDSIEYLSCLLRFRAGKNVRARLRQNEPRGERAPSR